MALGAFQNVRPPLNWNEKAILELKPFKGPTRCLMVLSSSVPATLGTLFITTHLSQPCYCALWSKQSDTTRFAKYEPIPTELALKGEGESAS